MSLKRILFALPIPFGHRWGFWTRDAGLAVLTLRKLGYDAWLVALGDATTETEGQPVLCVPLEEMSNAAWWKSQAPDAVVLCTWSLPRFDAVREAALAVTPNVVERLDTSGNRSCRLFPRACFIESWGAYRDKLQGFARTLAFPLALAKTAILYGFTGLLDAPMARSMSMTRALIVESPVAATRIQQIMARFAGNDQRIVVIPPPIDADALHYDGTPKQNRIIAVGRWDSAQKDYPMLIKVLEGFLKRHPDWEATVVGSGVPTGAGTEEWQRRITYRSGLSHEELAPEYNRAKIYLMVSRYESFCIAAAEALCCGCSVVGSSDVPSSYYFAETQSGMVAAKRTDSDFGETLDLEVAAWASGARDPAKIAPLWRDRAGSEGVSRAMVALLEEVAAGKPASTAI